MTCVMLCTVVFLCTPDVSVYLVGSDIKGGTFAADSTTSEDHAVYFFGKYSKDLLVEVRVHCRQMILLNASANCAWNSSGLGLSFGFCP